MSWTWLTQPPCTTSRLPLFDYAECLHAVRSTFMSRTLDVREWSRLREAAVPRIARGSPDEHVMRRVAQHAHDVYTFFGRIESWRWHGDQWMLCAVRRISFRSRVWCVHQLGRLTVSWPQPTQANLSRAVYLHRHPVTGDWSGPVDVSGHIIRVLVLNGTDLVDRILPATPAAAATHIALAADARAKTSGPATGLGQLACGPGTDFVRLVGLVAGWVG